MPRNFHIDNSFHYEEFFNLICGELLGEGIHRKVFECRIDPTIVIKIEQDHSTFANIREWQAWTDCQYYKPVADWLAPCVDISPNGTVMFQKRIASLSRNDKLPEQLPRFLTDVKPQNFGWLDGRIVCHDYPQMITTASTKLRKVEWIW